MKFPGLLILFSFFNICYSQNTNIGIFDKSADIGNPKNAGLSRYDEATQTYYMKGSGYNIWFNRDEFQYLFKKIGGDFILTADFAFMGDKGNGHRKIGWMIRESLDDAAASYNAATHGDGLTVLQWRPLRGAYMRDPEEEIFFPKKIVYQTIRLERIGKKITMSVANPGEPLQEVGSTDMYAMQDSVYVGLFISSHDSDKTEEAKMWNVRIDKPVSNKYYPNPNVKVKAFTGTLGSRLETMNVFNGVRKVIYESKGKLEAPGWLPDGKKLSFNENDSRYTIPVDGGSPEKLSAGSADPSNKNQINLKGITEGHADGAEYSPGKKYLYYNANPTGTMQIWRMKPDGSGKEQLTFNERHNWFPHISPDGKWIVYISFPPDINPNEHPSYENVTLNLVPASGGAPRVIAYLYGGEGTLNVNSWSPDSRHIAFVSNSEEFK